MPASLDAALAKMDAISRSRKLDDCVDRMDAMVRTDPPVSQAQRKAMWAAASGNSTLGIPAKVGKEFANADPGGKLPAKKDAHEGFEKVERSVAHEKGVRDPKAVAAAIGRKKLGEKEMARRSAAGRKDVGGQGRHLGKATLPERPRA